MDSHMIVVSESKCVAICVCVCVCVCVCAFKHRDALQAEIDQERKAKQKAMDERYVCM